MGVEGEGWGGEGSGGVGEGVDLGEEEGVEGIAEEVGVGLGEGFREAAAARSVAARGSAEEEREEVVQAHSEADPRSPTISPSVIHNSSGRWQQTRPCV